jgi:hypothetical protein
MAKQSRPSDAREARGSGSSGSPSTGTIGIATLIGVGVLVLMNVKTMTDTTTFKQSIGQVNERIDGVNNRIVALGTEMKNSLAKAGAPQQRGPDPNKVYPIKTQGAPAEGPENAPIVIAEFSDFQ